MPQINEEVSKAVASESKKTNRLTEEPEKQELELQALREREKRLQIELELAKLKLQLEKQEAKPKVEISENQVTQSNPRSDKAAKRQGTNRKAALVIGNNDYKTVTKLENATSDSEAISKLLRTLNYEVSFHKDLNEKGFKSAIRRFKKGLKGGEEVVFFYAGHGVQIGGTNYLLPTDVGSDSQEQIEDEGVPLQRVLEDFSESKVKFALALVDACRDNPFKGSGRAIGGRGLAPTTAASGQMIIFAAGSGQQALDKLGKDDSGKNGLFTRVLIDKVTKSDKPIHLLMRDVRETVANLAQSVGHEQVPAIYDQVIGDFYFKN